MCFLTQTRATYEDESWVYTSKRSQGCCSSRRRSSQRQLQVSLPLEDHRIPQPSRASMWSGMVHTIHHWPHPIAPPCDLLAFLTAVSWACVPCPVHVHVLLRRSCDERRCGEQTQRTCLLAVLQTTAPRGQDGLALCLPGRGALHVVGCHSAGDPAGAALPGPCCSGMAAQPAA